MTLASSKRGAPTIAMVGAVLLLATSLVALVPNTAGAVPSAGYGAGKSYCAKYNGGVASNINFDNVWACGGSTEGNTTFDQPGSTTFAWQCVELSARFLWAVDGIWAGPGTGYNEGAELVSQMHKLHPNLQVGKPGPGSVPIAGDVMSFGPGGAVDPSVGHTAVVISANPSTGKIETMSENFTSDDGDGGPGEQFWQVRLSGGENGYCSTSEALATPPMARGQRHLGSSSAPCTRTSPEGSP
jgi:hypothetical protein